MPRQLNDEEIAQCQAAFCTVDKDNKGTIDAKDLGIVIESLGNAWFTERGLDKPAEKQVQELIDQIGPSGSVTLDNFLKCLADMMIDPDSEEDMREAFESIDVDKSGFISRAELRKFLDNITQGTLEKLTEADVDEIMRAGDTDGDQKINFEEFCKMMKGHQIL